MLENVAEGFEIINKIHEFNCEIWVLAKQANLKNKKCDY